MRSLLLLLSLMVLALPAGALAQGGCCVENDNGNGTVDMPATCPYVGPMIITDGLPAGGWIDIAAELRDFAGVVESPGGNLGGTRSTFTAGLKMTMTGQGVMAGFNRIITVPVTGTMDWAPRTPGDAVQSFGNDLFALSGDLFGDPDFCILRVRAGTDNGLPSPGSTILTRLGPAGDPFSVDSFFDIHYTIEWQGCPGSILDGMAGLSEDTHRLEICPGAVPVEETTWGSIKELMESK